MVFLLLFWSLLFGLLMFCKYSVAMLVSVFLLCPFSVKMSIKKSISLWRCFSVNSLYDRERKPFNTPIAIWGAMFEIGFICTFVIVCWNINWTPTRQHKRKMGKFRCNWTLFKMTWSIQLTTPKDIITRSKI